MEIERRKRRHSHIDIAPLVDVVFNLLLFFMLTFNMAMEQTIPIRLPQSTTADELSASRIIVTLSREGRILIRNQPIHIEALSTILRQQPGWNPEVPVHIRCDREAPVGLLVAAIDAVRHSGSKHFQVVTEKSAPGSQ